MKHQLIFTQLPRLHTLVTPEDRQAVVPPEIERTSLGEMIRGIRQALEERAPTPLCGDYTDLLGEAVCIPPPKGKVSDVVKPGDLVRYAWRAQPYPAPEEIRTGTYVGPKEGHKVRCSNCRDNQVYLVKDAEGSEWAVPGDDILKVPQTLPVSEAEDPRITLKVEVSNLTPEQAKRMETLLWVLQGWGEMGHSGVLAVDIDGDGPWHPKITVDGRSPTNALDWKTQDFDDAELGLY
jgi:hypothetical protein